MYTHRNTYMYTYPHSCTHTHRDILNYKKALKTTQLHRKKQVKAEKQTHGGNGDNKMNRAGPSLWSTEVLRSPASQAK